MLSRFLNTTVTKIAMAVYVPCGGGKNIHNDRPYHGFVVNEDGVQRNYIFSDGTELTTRGRDIFYLPKGASYVVNTLEDDGGGCCVINFECDVVSEPFKLEQKASDDLLRSFKNAAREWRLQTDVRYPTAMSALYDAIRAVCEESGRSFTSVARLALIDPAIEMIDRDFSNPGLSVESLAQRCGISHTYLSRIFDERFGVSPKEYIISKRIKYACQLLESDQFTVSEIASMCGYTEPCHFSREFTRRVGVCPSDYNE